MKRKATLNDLLCFALYGASMAVSRTYKPLLDELGITYPQYLVLVALWSEDGQTVGSLAERLALESSTITPLIKRLETSGLVKRVRHHDDERRVSAFLTKRGRELEDESECLGLRLLERSGMKPQELMALTRQVQQLRTALTITE